MIWPQDASGSGTFRSLSDPPFAVGPQKDRVVGATIDELDQASDGSGCV